MDCDGTEDKIYTADTGDTQLWYLGAQIPGSYVWWLVGNTKITVRIPVEFWADCCEDPCYKWRVYGPHVPRGINTADDWIDDPCDCDMYPAEVKKFIEIYRWHDPITEDDITDEIYCEDFEEQCDVHDNFDSIDANADGDTWTLTDKQSHSADHSYHNTQHDTYMPNAEDYLLMDMGDPGLGPGLDVSGYDELLVSFWHRIDGDMVDSTILDYGWVEYSFTGCFCPVCAVFAGGLYYDNDWEEVTFTIDVDPLSPVDDNLYLRWGFISDAGFCYEGYYIDDVCVFGTTSGSVTEGWWEFIHDSHSWPQIIEGPYEWYCFPDLWTVTEEGQYKVCAWLEALDPCHYSMDTYGFEGDLCEFVDIGDILELELDCPVTITPPSPAWEGDDVLVDSQVCNIGTLDATDVQVQMTVNRGTFAVIGTESFEGETPGELVQLAPAGPGTYDDEWVRANPDGRCFVHYTNYEASDGSMAIAGYDGSTAQPWRYNDGPAGGGSNWVRGPLMWTGADTSKGIQLSFDAKANFDPGDSFRFGIMDFTTGWSWLGSVSSWFDWTNFEMDISGDFLAGAIAYGPPYFHPEDQYGFACRISYDGDFLTSDPSCPWDSEWSGYIIDNIVITDLVAEPAIIFQTTENIPFIGITDCEPVSFTWPNAGVGRYVVTTEILTADEDPANNICIGAYDVINIECDIADCGTVSFVDHTGGPSNWMVEGCCGGYLWCGDPVATTYVNNADDSLYLLDPADGDRTFDCSAFTTTLQFELDMAYITETNDYLFLEVSVDDGGAFWTCGIVGFTNPLWPNFDSYVIDCVAPLAAQFLAPTATTQFRLRFVSNDTEVNRGVYVDNIAIKMNPYIFGPDDCTTMDNFEAEGTQYGNWWRTPHSLGFAYGLYLSPIFYGTPITPDQTYGCYDPLAYFENRPWNAAYPDNIDNSLDWTLTLPHAFYGYVLTNPITSCGDGSASPGNDDTMLLQISDDGTTFDTLESMVDDCFISQGNYDVTDYLNSDVTIRYRVTSDGFTPWFDDGFMFEYLNFYGMEDVNAPVTTIELVGDIDPVYLYYTDGVAVYLTATDDVTGVMETWYELDGGAATLYVGPFMIEDDGTHQVCFWSVDFENNVETKKCSVEFKIDQSGPSVTITAPGDGLYLMGNLVLDMPFLEGKSIHLFGGVQVDATVTISGAPLKVVEFYMNDVLFAQDVSAPFGAFCTEKNQGAATFKVKAIDVLDNSAEATKSVDTYIKIL
jgi:hypothetical protein